MRRDDFDLQIVGLFKYFQRVKFPDETAMDEWFDELNQLSDDALRKAIRKLKDREKLPYNLPKAIKEAWFEYTKENPKKIHNKNNYKKCPGCNSSGGFHVLVYDSSLNRRTQSLVFCSECDNWEKLASNPSIQRTSASELTEKNIPFKPFNQVYPVLWDNDGWIYDRPCYKSKKINRRKIA